MPFQIHKKLHQTKMPIQISSHRRKNSARRAAGPLATSENPRPPPAASTPEDLAGYEIRPSLGFGRISQRSAWKQRSGRAWDTAGSLSFGRSSQIWPELSNPRLPSVGFQPAWDTAGSSEIQPSVGFPISQTHTGREWVSAGTLKLTPAERGFSAGSG
jgi:hypothetical protein